MITQKQHKRQTLMNYSKERLVDYCLMLEHNNRVQEETIDQQYKNCMQLIDDMKIVTDTYKHRHVETTINLEKNQ